MSAPPIRALIVDDEPLARDAIRLLLAADPEVEVVGEAGDGARAARLITELTPDLLFLDVQMPEMDGFQVLRAVPPAPWPVTVFVTAYDRYALRAFDFHAIDYLLKPFDDDRFAHALGRAKAQVRTAQAGAMSRRLVALLDDAAQGAVGAPAGSAEARGPTDPEDSRHPEAEREAVPEPSREPAHAPSGAAGGTGVPTPDHVAPNPHEPAHERRNAARRGGAGSGETRLTRLVIKTSGRIIFLAVDDIDWIEAADYYVRLHAGGKSHLLRESMRSLERQLDANLFFRIHRSAIVNLERVRELQPWFRGEYLVILRDGTQLKLSRRRRERLEAVLGRSL